MNKIEVLDVAAFISIELEISELINCRVIISMTAEPKQWGFIVEKNGQNNVVIKDQCFVLNGINEEFTEQEEKQINEGFYEIIRQLKNHPNHRLKMIHILEDDIRTIWNNI